RFSKTRASWCGRGRTPDNDVNRGEIARQQPQPLAGVPPAAARAGDRMPFREALEHMIAVTYGVTYDAVVTHFPPYEAMLEEIVAFVARLVPESTAPRATRVLDVACGIGNVSLRLAQEGYSVVGIDGVKHLVESAHRYLSATEFHETLGRGGFEVLEARQTFLSGLSRLAWCRAK